MEKCSARRRRLCLKGRGWGSESPSALGSAELPWVTEARKSYSPQLPGSSASLWPKSYFHLWPSSSQQGWMKPPWAWWQPTAGQQVRWSSADCRSQLYRCVCVCVSVWLSHTHIHTHAQWNNQPSGRPSRGWRSESEGCTPLCPLSVPHCVCGRFVSSECVVAAPPGPLRWSRPCDVLYEEREQGDACRILKGALNCLCEAHQHRGGARLNHALEGTWSPKVISWARNKPVLFFNPLLSTLCDITGSI